MMKNSDTHTELSDAALDEAQGGIALLLPAVQKVHEARPDGDALGNFEIQDLMSRTKGSKTPASIGQKK